MKYGAFFLIFFFTFQILDIPPLSRTSSPKTCCGRSVCLCTHAKGGHCDFKQRKQHQNSAGQITAESPAAQSPGFTKAPCHPNKPAAMVPAHVPDLDLPAAGCIQKKPFVKPLRFLTAVHYDYLFASSLDRPPRLF